jgi:hypothetical protein
MIVYMFVSSCFSISKNQNVVQLVELMLFFGFTIFNWFFFFGLFYDFLTKKFSSFNGPHTNVVPISTAQTVFITMAVVTHPTPCSINNHLNLPTPDTASLP